MHDHWGTQADGTVILILQINLEVPIHLQAPQVSRVPTGGVQTGSESTAGSPQVRLLALGGVLLLAAGISALFWRRRVDPLGGTQ